MEKQCYFFILRSFVPFLYHESMQINLSFPQIKKRIKRFYKFKDEIVKNKFQLVVRFDKIS